MNHILNPLKSKEGAPKSNTRNTIQGDFCCIEQIKCNTNGIKTAVQKTLICSKIRESAGESNGVTKLSNTSVDLQ